MRWHGSVDLHYQPVLDLLASATVEPEWRRVVAALEKGEQCGFAVGPVLQ
jgi:hypothetical protein